MLKRQHIDSKQMEPLRFWGLVIGLFLYLFPVVFLPTGLPLALFAYLIFGILWSVRPIVVPAGALPIGIAGTLLVVAAYAGLVTTLRGMNDLTFAVQIAKVATLYLGSGVIIGVVCIGFNSPDKFDILIKALVYCCLIQSIFIALGIFSIQFRVTMDSLIAATGNTNYLESFRVRGFSASGGASLGLIQAIGVLSALYFSFKTNKGYYFLIAIIIWIPIFFVARTGFFIGAIFVLTYFLSLLRIYRLLRQLLFTPTGLTGTTVITISILIIFLKPDSFFEPEAFERTAHAVRWGLELFLNLQSGKMETETTTALFDMLVIPDELSYFIFGFGVFDSGAFGYGRTDSGYLKTLYSSGIIGVFAIYGTLFSALLITTVSYNSREFTAYMLVLVAVIVVVELKEPFLYQNYFGRYAFILIGASAAINWYKRSKKIKQNSISSSPLIGYSKIVADTKDLDPKPTEL